MFFVRNKSQKVYPISECETEHSDSDTDTDTDSEEDFIYFTILRIINKYFNSNRIQITKRNDPLGMTYEFKNEHMDGIISTHCSHNRGVYQIINENDDLSWFIFIQTQKQT